MIARFPRRPVIIMLPGFNVPVDDSASGQPREPATEGVAGGAATRMERSRPAVAGARLQDPS